MRPFIIFLCFYALLLLAFLYPLWIKADEKYVPLKAPIIPIATSTPEFERIAHCESGGNLHAKNPSSSASGEFQFVWSTWNYYGKRFWGKDFYSKNIWSSDNRELAWWVYTTKGTSDWDSSKWCWNIV